MDLKTHRLRRPSQDEKMACTRPLRFAGTQPRTRNPTIHATTTTPVRARTHRAPPCRPDSSRATGNVSNGSRRPPHAPNACLLTDFDNVTLGIRSDLQTELKNLLSSD